MTVGKKWKQQLTDTIKQILTSDDDTTYQQQFRSYLNNYIQSFCIHFCAYNSKDDNYIVSGSKQQWLTQYNGIDFLPDGCARQILVHPATEQEFIKYVLQYVSLNKVYEISKLIKIVKKIIFTEFYCINKLPKYLAFLVVLEQLHYRNYKQDMTMQFYVNDNSDGYKQIKFIWKPSGSFDILKAKLCKLFKIT